jgi:hypothetical protein
MQNVSSKDILSWGNRGTEYALHLESHYFQDSMYVAMTQGAEDYSIFLIHLFLTNLPMHRSIPVVEWRVSVEVN